MAYLRSMQARQMDELRERLAATVAELERTRKDLHDARQIIATTEPGTHESPVATIQHRNRRAECGTNSGYVRHVRIREQPCDECKTAHAIYYREYRARKVA